MDPSGFAHRLLGSLGMVEKGGYKGTPICERTSGTCCSVPLASEVLGAHGSDFARHVDYIHFNPVKHGLVKAVGEWPYSTFHRHVAKGFYDQEWGSATVDIPKDIGKE